MHLQGYVSPVRPVRQDVLVTTSEETASRHLVPDMKVSNLRLQLTHKQHVALEARGKAVDGGLLRQARLAAKG